MLRVAKPNKPNNTKNRDSNCLLSQKNYQRRSGVWGWKVGKIPFDPLADAVLEFYIFLQRPQNARKELIYYYKKIDSITKKILYKVT